MTDKDPDDMTNAEFIAAYQRGSRWTGHLGQAIARLEQLTALLAAKDEALRVLADKSNWVDSWEWKDHRHPAAISRAALDLESKPSPAEPPGSEGT
jgi:hypothetical protein